MGIAVHCIHRQNSLKSLVFVFFLVWESTFRTFGDVTRRLHKRKINGWNLRITQLKRNIIFHPPPFTAVHFQGCTFQGSFCFRICHHKFLQRLEVGYLPTKTNRYSISPQKWMGFFPMQNVESPKKFKPVSHWLPFKMKWSPFSRGTISFI